AACAARLCVLRSAALHDARTGRADRSAPRERLPPAAADTASLLRVGPGPRRNTSIAAGAHCPDGVRRHVAFPRYGSLRVAGVRLRSTDARVAEGRPRP